MLRIAHRGASGEYPENTLLAYQQALDTQPDMVEVDIRVTKDKKVVVIHDATVDRTTNGKGKIKSYNLKELQKLNAGNGEKIPTLEEVLVFLQGKTKVNIDIKEKAAVEPTIDIIEKLVQEHKYRYSDFLISAFNPFILTAVQKQNTSIALALNFALFPDIFFLLSHIFNFEHVKPHKRLLKEKFIIRAHKRGWKVLVWTINKPKDIEKMKKLGVDGILSDYPDRI